MTKTKKILTVLVGVLLIAAAIFFWVYDALTDSFDYSKNPGKYVTIDQAKYLGISISVDDTKIEMWDDDDVDSAIGAALLPHAVKQETDAKKNQEFKEGVIGQFDQVFLNYVGYYTDGSGNPVYFTDGSAMNLAKLQSYQVGCGYAQAKLFADALVGKNMNEMKYTVVKKAEGATAAFVPDTAIVYIDFAWDRFTVDAADGSQPDSSSDDDENKDLVTESVRVDLSNPTNIPAEVAAALKGAEIGKAIEVDVIKEVEGVEYRYKYTVKPLWAVDEFTPVTIDYTYPADSKEKDIFGNELKGKSVKFDVVVSYYYDVPDLDAEYYVCDHTSEETHTEACKKESILTHDKYLNFDETDHFGNGEDQIKYQDSETWLQNNAGKTHADYIAFLKGEYDKYQERLLQEKYDNERMYAAGDKIWAEIIKNVKVTYPDLAVKVTYEELKDWCEYNYAEGSFQDANKKTVYYRNEYSTFKAFMAGASEYADEIKGGKTWKEALTDRAREIVHTKLIIYYLYDLLPEENKYTDDDMLDRQNANMWLMYLYGVYDSAKESLMFDKVLEYLYEEAEVTWASETVSGG